MKHEEISRTDILSNCGKKTDKTIKETIGR
jgi:hypothetical protein